MSPKVKEEPWSGDPLPRGRHKLPPETVRASQRERLLRAMAELTAEQGYDATTVPQVIARARVSSNTFYKFFDDKTDCFIALCEQLGEELFANLTEPFEAGIKRPEDALDALKAGIRTYLRWWPDRPALAHAYFVELPAAGPRAVDERERQFRRFEGILRETGVRARGLDPELPPLRDIEVTAAQIVARELVAGQVRAGKVAKLEQLEDDLYYLLLKLLVGEEAARLATTR